MDNTHKDTLETPSFIDIHHHLIYGLDDDGPHTFADTCAMLRAAHGDGIRTLIATPHVSPGLLPFPLDVYEHRLEEARAYCRQEDIPMMILSGAEILYTEMTIRYLQERRIPTLANTSCILVEFLPTVHYAALAESLHRLLQHGFTPVLAHAERYICLRRNPWRALRLHQQFNTRFQVNCSSLIGDEGLLTMRFCRWMLKRALVDHIATDAHNTMCRRVGMLRVYEALVGRFGREVVDGVMGRTGLADQSS